MPVSPNAQAVVEVIEAKVTPQKSKVMNWWRMQWRAILAELIATMLLIVFGCMACIPIDGFNPQPAMYAPFGFGLTVMFNIQIFGHISGAHMNPAVTVAALIWNKVSFSLAVAYIIVQCVGATLGYGILMVVSPIDLVTDGICVTSPHIAHSVYQALGIEIILTAALNFLNCGVWDPVNETKQDSVPIKFGLAIAGLSLAGGQWTGASMNPARSLGPALWTGVWTHHWVYWAGPLIGGSLSAIFYKCIWLNKR